MDNKKYVTLRIALIPDKKLSKDCVIKAKEISKLGSTYYVLDDKKYISHLTVYKSDFPVAYREKIYTTIRNIALNQKQFVLKHKGLFNGEGWLGLDFSKSSELYKFHKKIVNTLNPLRDKHIPQKYQDSWKSLPLGKRRLIKKYGYHEVMSIYHPHLSLLRFNDSKNDKIAYKRYINKIKIPNSKIISVAIVESGEHGTVTKIIKDFKLSD